MSEAMTRIVDAYVKVQDRKALEDLRTHRHNILEKLKLLPDPFDASRSIQQNQDELAVIEAGIARLAG